jgi:hypothetical protein
MPSGKKYRIFGEKKGENRYLLCKFDLSCREKRVSLLT